MKRVRTAAVSLVALVAAGACANFLGLDDVQYQDAGVASDEAGGDSTTPHDGATDATLADSTSETDATDAREGGDATDAGHAIDAADAPTDADASADADADADPDADADSEARGDCGEAIGRGPTMRVVGDAGYCIDSTEVTESQYGRFLEAGISPMSNGQPGNCPFNHDAGAFSTPTTLTSGRENHPVASVDWCDAWSFCQWAGKRLCGLIGSAVPLAPSLLNMPRFDQWYGACARGVEQRLYPYGDGGSYDEAICNSGATSWSVSTQICEGGYDGVYDMVGNIWEWTDTCEIPTTCLVRGGGIGNTGPLDGGCTNIAGIGNASTYGQYGFRCCSNP